MYLELDCNQLLSQSQKKHFAKYCKDFRTVNLMSHVLKIPSKIIHNKLEFFDKVFTEKNPKMIDLKNVADIVHYFLEHHFSCLSYEEKTGYSHSKPYRLFNVST